MGYYAVIFVAGIAGSFHCIGMCGGFACAVGAKCTGGRIDSLARQLLYNFGRLTVYAFLGGLAGSATSLLDGNLGPHYIAVGQKVLTLAAGLLMVIIALNLLGVLRLRLAVAGGASLVPALGALAAAPSRAAQLAFGIFNGFLPCPLIYAFLAQAMASGSAQVGSLTLVALGLGTFPTMLAMGWAGGRFGPQLRGRGVRLAGGLILALGLVTVGRLFVDTDLTGWAGLAS